MAKLFLSEKQQKLFKWTDVKTHFVRTQYNELLSQVLEKDVKFIVNGLTKPYKTPDPDTPVPPSYYDPSFTLALVNRLCHINDGVILKGTGSEISATGIQSDATKKAKASDKPSNAANSAFEIFDPLCDEPVNNKLDNIPAFLYDRARGEIKFKDENGTPASIDSTLKLDTQINFGAVIWLYYYERMGIFEILKVLMNDYNYTGKYPISGKSENITSDPALQYTELMDSLSTLYRLGIGSNQLDRKTLYQKVLGVTYKSEMEKDAPSVASEKNEGFMRNFNKLISFMIDFFRDKQLAQAINNNNSNSVRSSVATQTAIRDTIQVLQKNFEVFEYGRNRINTFLGIATVYATICLLRMIKDEIGVPRQYNEPHEFISAAYDILVTKTPITQSESNRFTVFDNCASYGYKLLADIELIDPAALTTVAIGSTLDAWLNDIEGNVEGYNNAVKSIPETQTARETAMA
jgi:hypothetical protein